MLCACLLRLIALVHCIIALSSAFAALSLSPPLPSHVFPLTGCVPRCALYRGLVIGCYDALVPQQPQSSHTAIITTSIIAHQTHGQISFEEYMKSSAALPRNYMIYMKQKDIQDAVRRFKHVKSSHRFLPRVEYCTENHYQSLVPRSFARDFRVLLIF